MNKLTERQESLLKLIVESYIETAEPVGSNFLVESAELDFSGATVRNEMRDLEDAGYLTHPHTSAGRIPTEEGYRYYVANIMKPEGIKKKIAHMIDAVAKGEDEVVYKKQLAKVVAEATNAAVIMATNPHSLYYTGLSQLFGQPEFRDYAHTVSVSSVFDQCEERIHDVYARVNTCTLSVLIGRDNPFGAACSMVVFRNSGDMLFAIVSPLRMPYKECIGILQYIQKTC